MTVREAIPSDFKSIAALLEAAFGGPTEARLVERLRADGNAEIELVAKHASEIVGHVLLSPLDGPVRALALAPLAVRPDRQRQGVGSQLAEAAHRIARDRGWQAVFVLGDPDYYRRFGYDAALAANFDSRYSGPCFLVLPLAESVRLQCGAVHHARAFAALEE